jgi:hypothetical protein
VVIAVINKHPQANNTEFTEKLEMNLEKIISKSKTSIVCGDIKINLNGHELYGSSTIY